MSRRWLIILCLGAFFALSTGIAQAIHIHSCDADHHSESCRVCALIVSLKVTAPDPPQQMPQGAGTEWLSAAPDPQALDSSENYEPISRRGPPLL